MGNFHPLAAPEEEQSNIIDQEHGFWMGSAATIIPRYRSEYSILTIFVRLSRTKIVIRNVSRIDSQGPFTGL
jgi:hypothetical protein